MAVPPGGTRGAGSSSAASIGSSAGDDARDMVEIAEYGWCRDETDGVRFVVGMRNVTDDKLVSNASATVTWRGEDGSVLGVDTAYFPRVYPGQTAYFGLFSTVSPGVSPASMEVEVSNDIGTSVRDASGETPELTVSEPSEISTGYGLSRITGEMSLEGTDDSFAGSQVMLVAIFRDEEGEIVYLDYGVATCPDAGESIAVETTGGEYPDYESLEVYALPAVI